MNNPAKTRANIQNFLNGIVQWVVGLQDIQAVALVGSYARDAAGDASDIDLVFLMDEPGNYVKNTAWAEQFGLVDHQQVEDYGRLISLRIWYQNGPEVEFGLTTPDWAAQPLDVGTHRVILDGMIVLHEKKPLLSPIIARI